MLTGVILVWQRKRAELLNYYPKSIKLVPEKYSNLSISVSSEKGLALCLMNDN